MTSVNRHIVHATTVSIDGQGVLILGASGAGKSALALQLIAFGGTLVADDRTALHRAGGLVVATCPEPIKGMIEARGVGLLHLPCASSVPVSVVVDLDRPEPDRLPCPHVHEELGVPLPALWRTEGSHFAASVLLWVKANISSSQ